MAFWFFRREQLNQINLPALIALLPGRVRFRSGASQVRYARAIIRQLPKLSSEFQINTPLRLAHFLAQGIFESGFLSSFEEGLYYTSAERIAHIYDYKFASPAEAQPFVRQPEALANLVYSGRNGNGPPSSGDGWRYRGSGLIQLTFRKNYRDIGQMIGVDLEANPDRLRRDPDIAVLAAAAFFKRDNLLQYADENNPQKVSRGVNRGNPDHSRPAHDEPIRIALTNQILALIDSPESFLTGDTSHTAEDGSLRRGDKGEDVRELQRKLNMLEQAAYNTGYPDGSFGPGTEAAVRAFQADHGLTADGVAGPDTVEALNEALADPSEGPSSARRGVTSSELAERGVRQAQDGGRVSGAGAAVGTVGTAVVAREVLAGDEGEASAEPPEPPTVVGDVPAVEEPLGRTREPEQPEAMQELPPPGAGGEVFVARKFDFGGDWVMIGLGLFLVLAAVFIVLRGRRISRDTEEGYRSGRIS